MTVKELLQIEDKEELDRLKSIRKFLVAKDHINNKKCKPILKMSFKDVNKFKELYSQSKFLELISFLLDCKPESLLKEDYRDFMYFIRFLDDEVINLINLEKALNTPEPGDELMMMRLEQAGADDLNVFGVLNTIDSLAGGDILKWEQIEEMPYEMIYTKLMMNKKNTMVQRRYQEIIIEEGKNKGK